MTEKLTHLTPELVETNIPRKQIYRGLSDIFAAQLIAKSRQPHIIESTPNDAIDRFNNKQSLEEWLAKGRDVYTLGAGQRLAGVIWYGHKEMPININADIRNRQNLPNYTFAIRLYEPYVGKGLAKPFMEDTLDDYLQLLNRTGEISEFRGLWLKTGVNNQRARKLYGDFGYKDALFSKEEVIMVLPEQRMVEVLGS